MEGHADEAPGSIVHEVVRDVVDAVKPRLRGWLHAGAAPLVLAAGIVLICLAPAGRGREAASIYAATGLLLFAISAVFHRGTGRWSPRVHAALNRFDHANVYLLIAGTYTPIAMLGLPHEQGRWLLWGVWIGAALGVAFRITWPAAPRLLYTALYLVLGWAVLPLIGSVLQYSGTAVFVLTVVGGSLYTVGAVIYALRRPDPWPRWFGFHEIFHVLIIAAWTSQYVAISLLLYRLR